MQLDWTYGRIDFRSLKVHSKSVLTLRDPRTLPAAKKEKEKKRKKKLWKDILHSIVVLLFSRDIIPSC